MSSKDLVNTLHQLAEVLQRQRTLGAALASLAEAATVSVPGCDAATIAISLSGRPSTAAITARVALELDMLQYDTHDGPCLTAFRTMSTVRVAQVSIAVSRSPEFVAARSVVEEAQRNVEDDADVNLASGLLMINEACTAEQAEGLLRQAALEDERTVVDIAQRIIRQHTSSGE